MLGEDADVADTGDQDTGSDNSGALDTGADTTTSKIEDALQTVNDAMMYGRQKHGLPTGDEDPAVQTAGDVIQGPWTSQGRFNNMDNAPTSPQPGQGDARPPIPIDTPLNNGWKGMMKPLQRTSGNIPTQPAGPGGDQPGGNPFPIKNPAVPFGRRVAGNIPTQPAGPGGDQPGTNPFPVKRPAIPFGRRVASNGVLPSYANGGPVHLEDGGPPDDSQGLDPSGLPIPDSAVSAPDSGIPQGQDLPYAPTPALPSSQDAGNAPGGDQGFDAQSVQNDPVYAFLSGAGKTSKELFDKYRSTAADANPDASDAELNALAIHGMPNQKMQWGGAQYLRSEADHQANTTRALLTNPKGDTIDGDKVADGITKMLANVPTGETVEAKYVENGLYQVTVTPPGDNKPPQVYTLNQNQVHDLANIGKAGQFDTLYEKGIGASLAALSQAPGTPVPGKAKPEADPTVTYNGIKGRYTQSEIAAMKERNKNQFGVPLVGDAKANVDYLESQRKARLEPEQKLEQAKAGHEAQLEIAKARDATVRRGQDIRGEGTTARTQALIDNAHTAAGARALADAVAELRTREGTGGQLSPDDVALQSYIRQTGMGQGQAAPAAAAPAPANKGINPATGAPALGKFRPGQTVYDKQGKPHIVQ